MKRIIWVSGLLLLLPGCLSVDLYDEFKGAAREVDTIKASDSKQDMQIRDLEQRVKDMQSSLRSEIRDQGVKVDTASAEGVRVTLPQAVLFPSGSSEISATGRKVLASVAVAALKGGDKTIRVVGHSDALPVAGKVKERFVDNWELSSARAAAVARVLVWGEGVAQERIRVEGHGSAEPVADNTTAKGRDQNRRIEIYIAG